jgi:hypothetical protein
MFSPEKKLPSRELARGVCAEVESGVVIAKKDIKVRMNVNLIV